ncbi:MAG TPA: response regulator [Terriglobia bacterium]|nr:response regulator [Terriglobia bacterium]
MTKTSLSNVSILCVDNYIESLELLKLSLELQGAQVYAAISAEEALRIFATNRIDILVSDLALPNADGIALLKAVRKHSPPKPAVALTGISDAAVREKATAAGFDHYLVKPVDEDVLIKVITDLVSKNRKLSA